METIQIIVAVFFVIVFLFICIMGVWVQLESKDEKAGKEGNGGKNFIIAIVIVIGVLFLLGMCQGKGGDWEPRHTQNTIIEQKNVNIASLVHINHCV